MEKVQIHPARIVTGALQCTNTQRLYKETKWQTLKQRHDSHCLCLFYKIVNGLTPSYLSSVLLERPAHGYNLRYSNDFPNILCCTNKYLYQLPSGFGRDWLKMSVKVKHLKYSKML